MNKKVLIVIGAAKYNKGSEILLRGTIQLVKNAGFVFVGISSADIRINESLNLPNVDKYIQRYDSIYCNPILRKIFNFLLRFSFLSDFVISIVCSGLINESKNYDAVILIAADNFDYNKRKNFLSLMVNVLKKKTKTKILLYDFSIKKENITKHLLDSSMKADLLTARDSLSFINLQNAGIVKNLFYYPDPAFMVKPEYTEIPMISKDKTYVGVNLSNLVANKKKRIEKYNKIMNECYKLIENIISKDNLNVLLIPHVMNGADLSVLEILYEKYKHTNKVFIIRDEQLNARQLKYIISCCRFFIGARTHSTIAAYSSCVPTLVLGYSIKSIGIAKDLFGTDENYVIPIDKLKDNKLSEGFNWLYNHEEETRKILQTVIPNYIKKTESVSELFKKLLE